ncbi:GNAT family protein [Robertmurraya sp. DFI.2.37]|uniref:GNAT family N-acetyltransferase n=1 Tax=Robertmurraya TaxID=2837507 RepID=UPI000BA5EBB7|nr:MULTISPECIES: GNAT family protein [Robertmurraya]MDF1510948.1 GNAT family protein [Robertmurraya sp. DFI.2.37]PAE18252.1 hypothetical protein CHH80_22675 [Bacillus sp. 7504-2]
MEKIYTLCPLDNNDNEFFYELYNDVLVQNNAISFDALPQTRSIVQERINRWMNSKIDKFFCIKNLENEPMGIAQIFNVEYSNRKCVVGLLLQGKYTQKGIGPLVLEELVRIAFYSMNLRKIEAKIHESNIPSIKMVERLKFTREGVLRESYYNNGQYEDILLYGLLKDEFKSNH